MDINFPELLQQFHFAMATPLTPHHIAQIKHIIDGNEQWLLTLGSLPSSDKFTNQTGNTSEIIIHNNDGFILLLHPHNPSAKFPTPKAGEIILYFAYVRPSARGSGILRKMLAQIPQNFRIRLEATKQELVPLWQHLGFIIDAYQPSPNTTTLLHRG